MSRDALRNEWYGLKRVFPVASGGIYPSKVQGNLDGYGIDCIVQAGGGSRPPRWNCSRSDGNGSVSGGMAEENLSSGIRKRSQRARNSLKIFGILKRRIDLGASPEAKPKSLYW